jgi:transketolase
MANPDVAKLETIAREGRVEILRMLTHAGSGHPGGSLSVIDILTDLYFNRLRLDPARPQWEDRDRFILSKGHCVPAQYFCMAKRGFFPMGMALGLKLAGKAARVYCVLGDGETQEGQVWESLMSAPKLGAPNHHLDNLCVILDYNGIQLDGFVKKILDLEPITDKLKAFGWPVLEVNGHDLAQVDKALDQAEANKGAPTFIVAHTVKGKGVSFMENDPEWHGKAPKPDEAVRAIREIVGDPVPAWAAPIVAELSAMGKK